MRPHRPSRDLIPHVSPHRPAHEPGAAGAPNVVERVGGGADDDDDDDDPRSRLQVAQLWLLLTVAWAVTGIVGVAMDAALVLLAASAELVTAPDVPPPHSDIPCWALCCARLTSRRHGGGNGGAAAMARDTARATGRATAAPNHSSSASDDARAPWRRVAAAAACCRRFFRPFLDSINSHPLQRGRLGLGVYEGSFERPGVAQSRAVAQNFGSRCIAGARLRCADREQILKL